MPRRNERSHGAEENCTRCVTSWTATHNRKSAGVSAYLRSASIRFGPTK
jgi:hypothetical protein